MKARDLGIPFTGETGVYNAITDVTDVEVGLTTLIEGSGTLQVGKGPIRTGVTIILPRGKKTFDKSNGCYASWYSFNGNGEMTGTTWIDESGQLDGPIAITNTHSVGTVHDAIIQYYIKKGNGQAWILPVVAETYDGFLNDVNGFHVREEHVFKAIESATTGSIEEGNVGGGTGMICHGFKGGTGTSSRVVEIDNKQYTVGVLVQANYGSKEHLTIRGIPIGQRITGFEPKEGIHKDQPKKDGSIIVIVATDAPLLPFQLKRLAKRVPLGIGRVGGFGSNSSGDIFLAFSTHNSFNQPSTATKETTYDVIESLRNNILNKLFVATVEATEEAILNALVSAKTLEGINGNTVYNIPHDQLQTIFSKKEN